jgi:hypothetical protein
MDFNAPDAYEQFSDASTTPIWDLVVGLATIVLTLGGGLAGVYAVGYLAVGRASLAWPLLGTITALVTVNLALRVGRRAATRRG